MSDFHGRIMNLSVSLDKQALACETVGDMVVYVKGHRDARHAAAEIALEADAQLEAAAEEIAQAEALFATFIAESDARAQAAFAAWEKQVAQLNAKIRALMGQVAAAEAALAAVESWMAGESESWMAGESGPLFTLWENGEVGAYEYDDGGDIDWPQTLANIRDLNCPEEQLGCDGAPVEVGIYRQVYGLLMAAKEDKSHA